MSSKWRVEQEKNVEKKQKSEEQNASRKCKKKKTFYRRQLSSEIFEHCSNALRTIKGAAEMAKMAESG